MVLCQAGGELLGNIYLGIFDHILAFDSLEFQLCIAIGFAYEMGRYIGHFVTAKGFLITRN